MSYWVNICYVLAGAYSCLILIYFLGWLLISEFKIGGNERPENKFSILIAARNEEQNILACLNSILQQKYPADLYEIIVLNDHSTDQTEKLVLAFITQNANCNIRLLNAENEKFSGKKSAITLGIERAINPYIILTDADCTRGENWLKTIDAFIQKSAAQMIYAPVFFNSSNLFEKFQSIEFAGLVGIGAAAIRLKNPNMCSAANLIFTKSAFLSVGGYLNNVHIASGDDEFLLHKIFKKFPREVHFLKATDAIVYTSPNASVNQLTQQRRRWVSKSTKYEDRYITAILVGAYFFNLSIFLNLILGIWFPVLLFAGLNQLLVKLIAEGLILGSILRFFNRTSLLLLMPLVQPFHIIYVILIGIWANVNSYKWKERELK